MKTLKTAGVPGLNRYGRSDEMSRKTLIGLAFLWIAFIFSWMLKGWIQDGFFGDDLVWLGHWIIPAFIVIVSSMILIFRKRIQAWDDPEM